MSGEEKEKLRILHVANISISASRDHIYNLFNYIGKIQDLRIYPSDGNINSNTPSKSAFVKFDDERCVEVGQHLTNTVLVDRALVCIPYQNQIIPDEETFFNSGGSVTAGQRHLPPHVSNKTQEVADGTTLLLTVDPTLEQLGLPQYPSLPGDTDLGKVEEIRRTVYVGNLPKGIDGKSVLEFFNLYIGEVMYVRMATGPEGLPCSYAYVEFSQQASVPIALQNSGIDFEGRPLKIQHSRVAILKPQQKTDVQALEEVEEAIRLGKNGETSSRRDREAKRSRSPRRRRTPSPRRRTRSPRRRSKSRDRDRRRSSRDRDRRSKSRDRVRSRSRDKKRRSRSRDEKRRSRSRDEKRRSRSRDKDRRRSRSRDKDRRRSRSRDRNRRRSKDRKREKSKERSKSRERKRKRSRSTDRKKEKRGSEDELVSLREKLLEKKAQRKHEKDSSDSEWEEAKNGSSETSKIKSERKRRISDSD